MLDGCEISLFGVELVEIDIVLDDVTDRTLSMKGIVGRDDGEAGARGFPSELRHVICASANVFGAQAMLPFDM